MIVSVFFVDRFLSILNRPDTFELTEDQIMQDFSDYWLSIPKDENPYLLCDLNSVSFNDGDDSLYVILPQDVPSDNIICYVRDSINKAYLKRLNLDLSSDIEFAGRTIKVARLNLPIMYISIDNSEMSYEDMILSNDKANTCSGNAIFTENNGCNDSDVRSRNIQLSMRGTSYKTNEKKSLTVAFDKSTELLDMGNHKKYNLLSNNYDPSLLKTELFFKMAEQFGLSYTPRAANISVFIDGNYAGVYTLTTKVSVGKNKIDISDKDYLINFGGMNPINPVFYESETYFSDNDLKDPYFDVCYPEKIQDTYPIQSAVQNFISSTENVDDDSYEDYVDIDDMIRYYWVQEIGMNYDACFRSTYATYNHSDQKIHMGPIWDMELTLGSVLEKNGIMFDTPDGWRIRHMSWYPRLFAREEFVTRANNTFIKENYSQILHDLSDYIKEREDFMSVDGELNLRLYRHIELSNILQERRWYYYEFADSIRDFYDKRIAWIEANLE